jgi:hypothetical protein
LESMASWVRVDAAMVIGVEFYILSCWCLASILW